jgi:hypothetical protein
MDLRRTPSLARALRLLTVAVAPALVAGCGISGSGADGDAADPTTTVYVQPPVLAPVCNWMSSDNLVKLVPEGWQTPTDVPAPTQQHTHCAWEGHDQDGNLQHQLRLIVDREIDRTGEDDPPPEERAEERFDAGQKVMLDDAARGSNHDVRTLDGLGDEAVVSDYDGVVRLFARRGVTVIEISYSAGDRTQENILEVVTTLAGPLFDGYPDPPPN